MAENPWLFDNNRLPRAHLLDADEEVYGISGLKHLYFEGPDVPHRQDSYEHHYDCTGDKHEVVLVTEGPTTQIKKQNVWHYEVQGDKIVVSPSIHFVGHFHTPNPVTFQLDESQWWRT